MTTLLIVPESDTFRVEAFDADGAGLLPFPSPPFATARAAELHGRAELDRQGIDPAEIVVDWPAE